MVKKVKEHFRRKSKKLETIVKNDLKLKPYKKPKVHGFSLTEAQNVVGVQKCQQLLAWHVDDDIIFSNKKLILLQETHNQQNDRVYSVSLSGINLCLEWY
jgi:hypothetical protein